MKNFRKKAAPAIVLLAGASMSLAGVTFAWFNENTTANINNINVGVVDASGGVSVSNKDDGIYKTSLDFDPTEVAGEIVAAEGINLGDVDPVSTVGLKADKKMFDFYKGTLNPDNSSQIKSASTDSGYITFDLFFENISAEDRYVYFKYTALPSNYSDSSNYASLMGEMFPNHQESVYSLRIGFIDMGNSINKKGAKNPSGDFIIVEPDGKQHTDIAKGIDPSLAGIGPTHDTYALKAAFDSYEDILPGENTSHMQLQKTYFVDDCNYHDVLAKPLFKIEKGYTQIRVVLWLEGQDIDNTNDVSGLDFIMNLCFDTKAASSASAAAKTAADAAIDAYKTTATDPMRSSAVTAAKSAINTKATDKNVDGILNELNAGKKAIDDVEVLDGLKETYRNELDTYYDEYVTSPTAQEGYADAVQTGKNNITAKETKTEALGACNAAKGNIETILLPNARTVLNAEVLAYFTTQKGLEENASIATDLQAWFDTYDDTINFGNCLSIEHAETYRDTIEDDIDAKIVELLNPNPGV